MIPRTMRDAASMDLLRYLADMAQSGSVTWSKAKVMVLGKEGVGKTNILH
jgi:hypothetical protein